MDVEHEKSRKKATIFKQWLFHGFNHLKNIVIYRVFRITCIMLILENLHNYVGISSSTSSIHLISPKNSITTCNKAS